MNTKFYLSPKQKNKKGNFSETYNYEAKIHNDVTKTDNDGQRQTKMKQRQILMR